jgi:hypothetical protein
VTSTCRFCESSPTTGGGANSVCHSGSRLATVGCGRKLYGGGGDGVAHSSVEAPHGFDSAAAPRRRLVITLIRNTSSDTKITAAPIVASRFIDPQPIAAG